ncbi:MAG: flagellar hook-basal body complex protein, partial [Oscillospiraceae bacterium]|nr:flagellar hook-basal body complex protein [Oscillospiraceae bacterium]
YINIAIDDAGVITGIPRNSPTGSKIIIGQLALGTFVNPAGLEKKGNSLYAESSNSGSVLLEHSGHGSAGKMNVGGLEMSNVDLSGEFTDMIITQRGFQANSRVITVSDTLLEELINLKR